MIYLIGDLQGCCDPLERLLAEIGFSPSRDRIHPLGDLINRGPGSLAVLRRLHGLGNAAVSLLGNHDLHFLAVAHGIRRPHRSDTVGAILDDPQRDHWLDWLRHQHMALHTEGYLMVHAGVVPQWTVAQTLTLAAEVESELRSEHLPAFLQVMYGNEPAQWSDALQGHDRLRFTVNALTRLRFCSPEGRMDFDAKEGLDAAPPGMLPWFDVPGRRTADTPIACGHWSTLGLLSRPDLLAIDTGCVWGGQLTAVRIDGGRREVIQVPCEQAQKPGK
jgi:bis(5'-nucleosyl)-tetraphosphatase (symmetrical)